MPLSLLKLAAIFIKWDENHPLNANVFFCPLPGNRECPMFNLIGTFPRVILFHQIIDYSSQEKNYKW